MANSSSTSAIAAKLRRSRGVKKANRTPELRNTWLASYGTHRHPCSTSRCVHKRCSTLDRMVTLHCIKLNRPIPLFPCETSRKNTLSLRRAYAVLTPCLRLSASLMFRLLSLRVSGLSSSISLTLSLSLSNSLSLLSISLSHSLYLSLSCFWHFSLSLSISLSLSLKRCYTGTPGHRTYDKYTRTPGHQEAPYLRNKSPSCNVGSPRCEGGSF